MELKETGKNDIITYSKAICMMLVVIGHSGINLEFVQFVTFFHVPLFFYTSGFCFKDKYLEDSKNFVIKRINGLWKPFVLCSVSFILLHNLMLSIGLYDTYSIPHYSFWDIVKKIVLSVFAMANSEIIIGPIYFLRSLFLASIISFALIKFLRSNIVALLISFLLTIISSFLFLKVNVFGWIEHFFFSSTIFLLGYVIKDKGFKSCNYVFLFLYVIILCIGANYHPCPIRHFTPIDLIVLSICTPTGILGVMKISEIINNCNYNIIKNSLKYVGNHTLSIFLFHFACFKIYTFFIIVWCGISWNHLSEYPVIESNNINYYYVFSYSFIGIVLPLILNHVWSRMLCTLKNLR